VRQSSFVGKALQPLPRLFLTYYFVSFSMCFCWFLIIVERVARHFKTYAKVQFFLFISHGFCNISWGNGLLKRNLLQTHEN